MTRDETQELTLDEAERRLDARICKVLGCDTPAYLRSMCNAHYIRWRRHGSATAGGTSKGEPKRWLLGLVADPPDQCVEWPFANNGNGYGWAYHDGRRIGAHRLSLLLATGEAPDKMVAAHSCHNKACVNPLHLRWASCGENIIESMPNSKARKLSDAQVQEIRRRRDEPAAELAKEYGMSLSYIYKVWKGQLRNG